MTEIKILNETDIEKLFTLPMAIEMVERAYVQKHSGTGEVWPMVFHEFEKGKADLDIKSGNLKEEGIYGLKVVSWFDNNLKKGLPALYGTLLIFDIQTGCPKALLNAGAITHLRTGAAGANGVKYLARKDSKILLMAGTGELAPYLIAATLYVMPNLESVLLANPRNLEKAEHKLEYITQKVDNLLLQAGQCRTANIIAVNDLQQSVSESDIILTATPAYQPFIKEEWIKPGTHLSCIGADMSGKQEIESGIFAKARIFGDDIEQCLTVGECEKPYKEGVLTGIDSEIGAVIARDNPGRLSQGEITVFDSTGIALQDLACAASVLKKAEEENIGTCAFV